MDYLSSPGKFCHVKRTEAGDDSGSDFGDHFFRFVRLAADAIAEQRVNFLRINSISY
jgi:hypothetical protein